MDVNDIVKEIRAYPGLTRKENIHLLTDQLQAVTDFGKTVAAFGEDAAAIEHGDEYLLLAADGILAGLIDDNPYGAGKASVMASVNDIYAMGGRPLAMVNVVGIPDSRFYDEIVQGIKKGCEKYRVPMVGGHLHPDTQEPALSVSIIGVAKKLLLSNNARPGQDIVFAVDLQGRGYQCRPVLSWDTNSGKTTEQVLPRLEVLPQLAEQGLCETAKDVSNAGLLGTIALLLETSGTGARVDLDAVPKPDSFVFIDWFKAFLSYGFVLSVDRDKTDAVVGMFTRQAITARVIGEITEGLRFDVLYGGKSALLLDLARDRVTGVSSKEKVG